MAYVYCHFKMGSPNKVFYIGIGGLFRFDNYKRAYNTKQRSKIWKETASQVVWDWEILEDNLTKEEALNREKYWIASYGRLNLRSGTLSNLTNGGEGSSGAIPSEETRRKMSIVHKGRKIPKHLRGLGMLGKTHSKETRAKLSEINKRNIGSLNPFFGRKQNKEIIEKHSKIVLNLQTGIYYDCAKEASNTINMNYSTFRAMLNGTNSNKTDFIYISKRTYDK